MKLLLLSNSTAPDRSYLAHARDAVAEHLRGVRELLFVPYALADHTAYTARIAAFMDTLGVRVRGVHTGSGAELVRDAEAVFVGGGNSFRLLKALQQHGLLEPLRAQVASGARYLGSSAGTNMACPTLRTTNDMPIVSPDGFRTLDLLPCQLNPHYLDPAPDSGHMGETREQRVTEFLEENDVPVLALREGTWLHRDGEELTLGGAAVGARLFRRGTEPAEHTTGDDLSHLLTAPAVYDRPLAE